MSDPTSVKNAERLVVSLAAKHPSTGVLNVPVSRPLSASCPLSAVLYPDPASILIRWTELKRLRLNLSPAYPLHARCVLELVVPRRPTGLLCHTSGTADGSRKSGSPSSRRQ
jgi:hypothetical protein